MILSVHAVFGAAVSSLVPSHPILGFTLGFVSHFALDAIPHRDYDLISVNLDKEGMMEPINPIDIIKNKFRFIRDVVFIFFDALVGVILAFMFLFNPLHPLIFLIGAIGSMVPDFLTFLYLVIEHKSLSSFYNFHSSFIHSKVIFNIGQAAGVFLQFCTITLLIAILYCIKAVIY